MPQQLLLDEAVYPSEDILQAALGGVYPAYQSFCDLLAAEQITIEFPTAISKWQLTMAAMHHWLFSSTCMATMATLGLIIQAIWMQAEFCT